MKLFSIGVNSLVASMLTPQGSRTGEDARAAPHLLGTGCGGMQLESVGEGFAVGIRQFNPARGTADIAGAVEIQPAHDLSALFGERDVEWPIATQGNGGGFADLGAVTKHA